MENSFYSNLKMKHAFAQKPPSSAKLANYVVVKDYSNVHFFVGRKTNRYQKIFAHDKYRTCERSEVSCSGRKKLVLGRCNISCYKQGKIGSLLFMLEIESNLLRTQRSLRLEKNRFRVPDAPLSHIRYTPSNKSPEWIPTFSRTENNCLTAHCPTGNL